MFHVDHYAISVADADRSIAFYSKLEFALVKAWRAEDGSVRIVHMKNDNFILEMFCYPDGEKLPDFVKTLGTDLKVKGAKHLGLWVEDLEAAACHLQKVGVIDSKPEISQGRLGRPYFFIKDPDGIFVEIISARYDFGQSKNVMEI